MSDALSRIAEELCYRRMQIFYVFTASAFFVLLQVLYLLFADPVPAAYVVSVFNLVGLGSLTVLSGLTLWYCKSRQ